MLKVGTSAAKIEPNFDPFLYAHRMTGLVLREEDVVKLACEFLQNRDLHISQVRLQYEVTLQQYSALYS